MSMRKTNVGILSFFYLPTHPHAALMQTPSKIQSPLLYIKSSNPTFESSFATLWIRPLDRKKRTDKTIYGVRSWPKSWYSMGYRPI